MSQSVEVREYARLTTAAVEAHLDQASIPSSAFDWLCERFAVNRSGGAPLVQVEGARALRLDNYVGVVETPCGTRIEILPKHVGGEPSLGRLRALLVRMITQALDLPVREMGPTGLQLFDHPASEWLISRFLQALDRLVKRGLRFEYERIEEESRFLRGQLDVGRQLRQPPGRRHLLHIRHDVFSPDRPENRLLKAAVVYARQVTRQTDNWRLAHELSVLLEPVPASQDFERDFRAWRHDRLTALYTEVRPWCELLLQRRTPLTQAGDWQGLSLLFPMESLYERFVAGCLAARLAPGARLRPQASSEWLCRHRDSNWFQLRPDLLVSFAGQRTVLDTKWKRLDISLGNARDKYGLSQSDFYQLYAYGQRYLSGAGELFLIYPRTDVFQRPLEPFHFDSRLRLWVVPFDLDSETLVQGEWCEASPWWCCGRAPGIRANG